MKRSEHKAKKERQRRDEVRRLISVLEDRIGELADSVESTETLEEAEVFQAYRKFRVLMSSCVGFSIIIEGRLRNLSGEAVQEMHAKFDELTVAIWSIVTLKALEFFNDLSQMEFLPLGLREMFMGELKTLYEANNILRKEKYSKLISDALWTRIKTSERILKEVIDRAPALLNLG